jgi:hypothetical protein
MDARPPEADDRVLAPGDHPHWGALERCHQVRLPLISTRGRVQIGSSREPNLLPEGEVDALVLEQLVLNPLRTLIPAACT